MRKISKLIIHCSATPQGRDIGAAEIRQMHVQINGWSDIGYHYVIRLDGSIEKGRDDNITGAHCMGQNTGSLGICYIGGLKKDGKTPCDTRTRQQKKALLSLLQCLHARYPSATVHGHNEFSNKACPSFIVNSDDDITAIFKK